MLRTFVYIDGINLYYGALRKTAFMWLDVSAMCRLLLPGHDLRQIRYFSAEISARPGDPSAPQRQQTLLRALRTLPSVSIHLGQFLTHTRRLPLASSPPGAPQYVDVLKTEEKGTDVNIATYLLSDGYEDRFDCAVLVANDSDLLEPVRIVAHRLKKRIGIVNPHKHPSKQLLKECAFLKQIRQGVLRESQLPAILHDKHGTITKPTGW